MSYGTQLTNFFRPNYNPPTVAAPRQSTNGLGEKVRGWVNNPTANPPFALARTSNPLISNRGEDAQIVRGYIRRDTDTKDQTSRFRLNFMYNPESIQRNYVAYLNQGALDPYNTIYKAGNLVLPPGILDFSFELLFDRQIEAGDPNNRGCGVDYDYFERVIRGVEPGAPASINNIPDSGVLLVNPRTVSVVFSEQLQVQGKVNNAVVSLERFNHLMIPTRMRIGIQMKVTYIGSGLPNNKTFSLGIEHAVATTTATVPYDNQIKVNVKHTEESSKLSEGVAEIYKVLGIDVSGSSDSTGGGNTDNIGKLATAPASGGPLNIVTVGGIRVDQSIASNLTSMITAAAQNGVKLTGGGYRSNEEQRKLRAAHGCPGERIMDPNCKCSPPTAIPGRSQHEVGLAIDFNSCARGGAVFNWLTANAWRFGFKNLPSESWHWSTTGG